VNVTYALAKDRRSTLHAENEHGDPLCGTRKTKRWGHGTGEPTCKRCLKLLAAMPATVERQWETAGGGHIFVSVTIGGMKVNGQAGSNEAVARSIADSFKPSSAQPKRVKGG
jgi:hypothetical protein